MVHSFPKFNFNDLAASLRYTMADAASRSPEAALGPADIAIASAINPAASSRAAKVEARSKSTA
jgi:hypothetical protein